jgi:hypothetical protein
MLERLDTEPDLFFCGVVTGDGSPCFEYNPENKKQSGVCRTPQSSRQKETRMNKNIKKMLVIFIRFSRGST